MGLPTQVIVITIACFVLVPILAGCGLLWGNDALRQRGGSRRWFGIASMICSVLALVLYAGWFLLIQFL